MKQLEPLANPRYYPNRMSISTRLDCNIPLHPDPIHFYIGLPPIMRAYCSSPQHAPPVATSVSRHDIRGSLTCGSWQRQPQLVENGEFSAELDCIDSRFVEALQEEETRVAQHHDGCIEHNDEDVYGDEIAQIATGGVAARAEESHVLEV
ncbi:Integral membrane protein [Pyrenophora tritici-repentis]|nr:Integral membrane protein [Pyrenophora tritici-repentis]KAG9378164.1 Integral membrane protein [Pyrenophora tritici-repentis]